MIKDLAEKSNDVGDYFEFTDECKKILSHESKYMDFSIIKIDKQIFECRSNVVVFQDDRFSNYDAFYTDSCIIPDVLTEVARFRLKGNGEVERLE